MSDEVYPVPAEWAAHARVDAHRYETMYRASIDDADAFWLDQARRLDWLTFPTKADESCFEQDGFGVRWFADGHLNVSANCLDRHLASRGNAPAIIWEPDDPAEAPRTLTYLELYEQVCRLANVLKAQGVAKGDRVTIYMPMIPEAAVALLACARIGAIHSVVFGGFSPEALAGRIENCGSKLVITADEGRRGGKPVPLKANVDAAIRHAPIVEKVIVVAATGGTVAMVEGRDLDYATELAKASVDCPPTPMGAEDPLFILYTSGSTGQPKGVMHTSGGYLLWASLTHETVFDYRPGQIYWCAADIGWVTGHSYIVYGPLANGGTTLMYEGVPNWPDASRIWQVVDRHQVEILYTAPTALRALMKDGDAFVAKTSRKSLKILGTVGEPINPEAWRWYHEIVGEGRCPIMDTWWQTETGGHMITPLPGATHSSPAPPRTPSSASNRSCSIPRARRWKARPRAIW
jgi:acetyl-CoA synthetase